MIAPKTNGCCSGVFWQSANGWRQIGGLYPTKTLQPFHATQLEAARADRSSWHDLVVGEQRFKIHISQ